LFGFQKHQALLVGKNQSNIQCKDERRQAVTLLFLLTKKCMVASFLLLEAYLKI
jgi:hypothetical protein